MLEEQKNIKLSTYKFKYIPFEDRIQMTINEEDKKKKMDFMITRNMVGDLIPLIESHLNKNYKSNKEENNSIDEILIQRGMIKGKKKEIKKIEKKKVRKKEVKKMTKEELKEELLLEMKEERLVLNNFSLQYFKEHKKSKILIGDLNERERVIGVLGSEKLYDILELIKSNIPRKWLEGIKL